MDMQGIWLVVAAAVYYVLKKMFDALLDDWLRNHKEAIKRALNLSLAAFLSGTFVIGVLIRWAFQEFDQSVPATKRDVLTGLMFMAFMILLVINTVDDLGRWLKGVLRPPVAKPAPVAVDAVLTRGQRRKP